MPLPDYAYQLAAEYWPGLSREDFEVYAADDYPLMELEWADMVDGGEGPLQTRLADFYEHGFGMIFTLLRTCDEGPAAWPADRHRINIVESYMAANGGGRQLILNFGGGIGSEAIYLARDGHQVCYADLGQMARFATWRFAREGLLLPEGSNWPAQAAVAVMSPDAALAELSNWWDTIIALDVIEHLPDAPGTLMEMGRTLKPGGLLILTRHSFKEHPSHNPATFWLQEELDIFLAGLGLEVFARPDGCYGIGAWQKPSHGALGGQGAG